MTNASAPKLIRVPMNERELYTLTMLFIQAVQPKGRMEEKAYNRVFSEMGLEAFELRLSEKPAPSIGDMSTAVSREIEIGIATAEYVIAQYDKVEGKIGPAVRVLLPVIERLENAKHGEPTPA